MNLAQIPCRLLLAIAFVFSFLPPAGSQEPTAGKSRVVCYTSYDQDYFYIAAVVTKPALAGTQTSFFSRPKEDDSVAVYLQSDAAGARRSAKSVEMAVSVAGGVQLYRGANAVGLASPADFLEKKEGQETRPVPFKFGVKRKGSIGGAQAQENGYTVEMAIPWIELGDAPAVGQRMRFNVVAYSADPGTARVLSLSPGVKTEADVQKPALWSEIVFVDAPVRTVASAPDAKVCPRLYTAKPLVDGELEEGPWNTLTAFGFVETATGAIAAAPAATLSRIRPKVNLKPARPPLLPVKPDGASPEVKPHTAQPVPRLVMALYQYDYQNDPRKQAPYRPVRTADGATRLSEHPIGGTGPWMTYDRVDWHRAQLEDIQRAGIDVILPIYRASAADKQRHATRGLMTLTAALKQMHAASQDYPVVGLHLDTETLPDSMGEKLNLKTGAGMSRIYAAIKDFYLMVPARFRAAIPLSAENGGGDAYLVSLSTAESLAGLDGAFVSAVRRRFKQEFGADLLFIGSRDFEGKAALDGYVADSRDPDAKLAESGWIRPASLGPGYDPIAPREGRTVRRRDEGLTYRNEWKRAIARQASWVIVDGWNDFEEGAQIAPSLQYGVEYVDLTRSFGHIFRSGGTALRASYLSHNVPSVALAGSASNVTVRLSNAGAGIWPTGTYALAYRWKRSGAGAGSAPVLVPLPESVVSGQSISIPFLLNIPREPGAHTLTLDIAQVGKKGDVTAMLSSIGSPNLEVPVRIAQAGEAPLPDFAVRVVSNDLSTTAETGGTYVARVTLRNDGSQPWTKGGAGRVVARVWRYISPINGTGEKEAQEPVEMADASAEVNADVPPGGLMTVLVPITFATAEDEPLRPWSQADNWSYQLRWEYSADEKGAAGAVSSPEPLALVDADFGVQFLTEVTPSKLPGERRQPVKIGLRNVGPQTWAPGAARVGYHWYYLDGTEVMWQDETTAIPQEIEPGGEVSEMLAWVAAPPYDGTYWLVWDLKIGDTWASTLPSFRSSETLVRRVEVTNGRLRIVDLKDSYNLDGVAGSASRRDGGFDTSGRTLPAELVPPFATFDDAPAAMWLPTQASGVDSPRRISFRWGPKGEKDKNFVQCNGQKMPLGDRRKAESARMLHLLAASTKPGTIASFILLFEDGSEQLASFPVSAWDAPPAHGEELAYFCRFSRTPSGDDPQKPVALFHYVIKVAERKKLVAIQLPNAPDIKIAAVTLEK